MVARERPVDDVLQLAGAALQPVPDVEADRSGHLWKYGVVWTMEDPKCAVRTGCGITQLRVRVFGHP